jgi:hypothetical protein
MDTIQEELKRRRGEPVGDQTPEVTPSTTESQPAIPIGTAEPTVQPPAGSRFQPESPSPTEPAGDRTAVKQPNQRQPRTS